MPRGGYRPGAGRPRKKANPGVVATEPGTASSPAAAAPTIAAKQEPLEYLLGVVNDRSVSEEMRLRAAIAAAPFVHQKMGEGGKKAAKADAAKQLALGGSRFAAPAPPRAPERAKH